MRIHFQQDLRDQRTLPDQPSDHGHGHGFRRYGGALIERSGILRKSDGAFDITIEPLSSLWNFTSGEAVIPDETAIEADIPKVDYHNLVLSGNTLTFLSPDTTIDLGSIAKGYIADRIKDQLLDAGP